MNSLLHFLIGTWFVTHTNFPMWTKGNKTDPTFNYSLVSTENSSEKLFDEVKYVRKGKTHSIKGYDYPDKKDNTAFIWKGKGLLGLLKSRWKVVLKDEQGQWAVIYFSKTLFTPEGTDVISKTPSISEEQFEHIRSLMLKDSLLKKQVNTLKRICD